MDKTTTMTDYSSYVPSLADLRFEYDEYLLEWVDCGVEPMSFEQFVKSQA